MKGGEFNDAQFSRVMRESMLRMPFKSFEDDVMARIQKQALHKRNILNDTRLSCFFFVLGTGFGLGINYFLSHANESFLGLAPRQMLLFFQIGFIFTGIMQLEKIWTLVRSIKRS